MSALRRAAVRLSLAVAIASAFAGAAAAQFKLEPIGDWDRVTVEHLAVFVAAVPNTRAARAYCVWSFLNDTHYVGALERDPEVMKAGLARDYACLRLDCKLQGHDGDAGISIYANAPPPNENTRVESAFLRMRIAPGEEPIVLFERAQQRARSRDGQLELLYADRARPHHSEQWGHVRPIVALSVSTAFLERLAAAERVEFELLPWANPRGPGISHAGRTVSFSLARMPDVLVALRQHCAERGRRRN
jgi:hypothetical protein